MCGKERIKSNMETFYNQNSNENKYISNTHAYTQCSMNRNLNMDDKLQSTAIFSHMAKFAWMKTALHFKQRTFV
jgi:hypothetical protein